MPSLRAALQTAGIAEGRAVFDPTPEVFLKDQRSSSLSHSEIHNMRARCPIAAVALAFGLGCSDSSSPLATQDAERVRIEPTAAQYRTGDSVWVELRNVGDVDVAYNLCSASRERFADADWVSAGVLGRNCPDNLSWLRIGTSVRLYVEVIPSGVASGLYRYTFEGLRVSNDALRISERRSASFRVRE